MTTTTPPSTPDSRQSLDNYIRSLNYDRRKLLSVQEDGATESLPSTQRSNAGNAVIITTKRQHSLRKNLSDVAILRPTAGVIFPGALVIADRNLMEGQPTPIGLARGTVTISTDLPGLQNSRRQLTDASNSSLQDAINSLVEEWNHQTALQGYVNAARSYLEVKSVFSSQQVALDLGFSAKWASGSAAAQLNASNDAKTSVVLAHFKQVFYTVTMDTPARPSDVFGGGVTLEQLQSVTSAEQPPAYVRSVDYGRILMIKMETTSRETKVDLQGAMKQVTSGGTELEGSLKAKYAEIVKNASFTVVAIGGGAQTAASFTGTEEDLKLLKEYIRKDATFRRDNPGAPVSYAVAFLKDNQLATMGFTTDYTETESVEHANGFVKVRHSGAYVARFTVSWEEPDSAGNFHPKPAWTSGNQTVGYVHQVDNIPGDARNLKILAEVKTGLIWNPWAQALSTTLAGPSNLCYRIKGTTLDTSWDNNC